MHVRVGTAVAADRESPLAVTLVQGLAAADRMDYAIQKSVELGVHAIQPVAMARSVARLDAAARREAGVSIGGRSPSPRASNAGATACLACIRCWRSMRGSAQTSGAAVAPVACTGWRTVPRWVGAAGRSGRNSGRSRRRPDAGRNRCGAARRISRAAPGPARFCAPRPPGRRRSRRSTRYGATGARMRMTSRRRSAVITTLAAARRLRGPGGVRAGGRPDTRGFRRPGRWRFVDRSRDHDRSCVSVGRCRRQTARDDDPGRARDDAAALDAQCAGGIEALGVSGAGMRAGAAGGRGARERRRAHVALAAARRAAHCRHRRHRLRRAEWR